LFERPRSGERAVLVHLRHPGGSDVPEAEEFEQLAVAAGAQPLASIVSPRQSLHPRYLVGSGKAEEIRQAVIDHEADLVLIDHALTPAQERNLEKLIECRVLDRTGLILDIFAQRASSFEGKLQVELAQLNHLSTRLVRGWTHLERQKGGIGLRGPGETQLETDRRLIGKRIKQINRRLDKVRSQRRQGRRARDRASVPVVSLAGYTNAGKTTLFNRLTDAGAFAAGQMFATLDTTLRRIEIEGAGPLILSDTVGFIRHLPHDLVEAFQATLEETREADLILHVVDAGDDERAEKIVQVNEVLREIGAGHVPQIQVYNKIDLLDDAEPRIEYTELKHVRRVWVSAGNGEGIDLLCDVLRLHFSDERVRRWLHLPAGAGRLRARLFESNAVVEEYEEAAGGWRIQVEMPEARLLNLCEEEGITPDDGPDQLAAGAQGL